MSEYSSTNTAHGAIEQLLIEAAADNKFKEALVVHRAAAARAHGFNLSASEQATLAAIPEAQLRVMIENITPGRAAEEPVYVSHGVRPDYHAEELTAGIRPEDAPRVVPGGIRPDLPSRVLGIRPAHLLLGAAAVTTAALAAGSFCMVTGSRPDFPPEETTQSLTARSPDAAPDMGGDGGAEVDPPGDDDER